MASQDFLDFDLRAFRPKSLVEWNAVLPANFKLVVKSEGVWQPRSGVHFGQIDGLTLKGGSSPIISANVHYNLRVTEDWSGWGGITLDSGDPDFGDARLNKSELKRWFKNNGVELLDDAVDHPRSGRADMRWWHWVAANGIDWLDITIDEPLVQARIWGGDVAPLVSR